MTAIRIIDDHIELANIGSNTHAQIDSHISNTSNPHTVTKAQVGLGSTADGAEVNVQSDWNAVAGDAFILNKPSDVTDLSGHAVTELSDVTVAGSGIIISDAERTKLTGIETAATTDQTKADIDGLGLSHDSLVDVSVNDHHNELHSIASHNDTSATGTQLDTLTDNSIADALHRHSELVASDGSPDPALSVNASGYVGIGGAATTGKLEVAYGLGEVPIFGITTADTSVTRWGQVLKHTTSGNMSDGFGVKFVFRIEDATSGIQSIAGMDATRDGADNIGRLAFLAGTNGSQTLLVLRGDGRVGLGTPSPATSAKLDLTSATGALLLSRMTTIQKNALTAVNGMLVYDSTLNRIEAYENGSWVDL